MKAVSFKTIMAWEPCDDFPEVRIKRLMRGRKALSVADILRMRSITHDDKLWAVLHNEFFTDRELRLMACDFAERVLPMFEAEHPNDNRPRKAIEVSRRYSMGEATDEELGSARSVARCAAWCAMCVSRSAAGYAAWSAARAVEWSAKSASRAAAESAAMCASRSAKSAERKAQIKIIKSYMEVDDENC